MIDLYYYPSPNTRKIVIALEELRLPYEVVWTDITAGDQFTDGYRAVNPNSKVPAIVDHDGPGGRPLPLFESATILQYLAEKAAQEGQGTALLPADPERRWTALAWTAWQVANQGPACGNATHFTVYAPGAGIDDPYGRERFQKEAQRCYRVLDERLADREYLADEFSIADIACFPWTRLSRNQGVTLADHPNLAAWSARIADRPTAKVQPADHRSEDQKNFRYTDEQFRTLFNAEPQRPRGR